MEAAEGVWFVELAFFNRSVLVIRHFAQIYLE